MVGEKDNLGASEVQGFRYLVEVYMDDFMSLVTSTSRAPLEHVATAIMTGIHDVFPAQEDDTLDLISHKKMAQGDGRFDTIKTFPGFRIQW